MFILNWKGCCARAVFGFKPMNGVNICARAVLAAIKLKQVSNEKMHEIVTDDEKKVEEREMEQLEEKMPLLRGIGIATGIAYCGIIGAMGSFRKLDVFGDVVNLAARLMSYSNRRADFRMFCLYLCVHLRSCFFFEFLFLTVKCFEQQKITVPLFLGILVNNATYYGMHSMSETESVACIEWNSLPPIVIKGMESKVAVFEPKLISNLFDITIDKPREIDKNGIYASNSSDVKHVTAILNNCLNSHVKNCSDEKNHNDSNITSDSCNDGSVILIENEIEQNRLHFLESIGKENESNFWIIYGICEWYQKLQTKIKITATAKMAGRKRVHLFVWKKVLLTIFEEYSLEDAQIRLNFLRYLERCRPDLCKWVSSLIDIAIGMQVVCEFACFLFWNP